MCGDHLLNTLIAENTEGSPPHVRGPHDNYYAVKCDVGITPACAGTTLSRVYSRFVDWGHPRMCGDHKQGDYIMKV